MKTRRAVATASLALLLSPLSPLSRLARAGSARPAPAVELRTADGEPVRLADFRGKVVLVDFWASWCGTCKTSFPELDALDRQMRSRGLVVLAINVDEQARDAQAFLAARPHQLRVAFDPKGRSPQAFGVNGMPSTYVIDRNGIIRYEHVGYSPKIAAAYKREIDELLAEPAEPGPVAGAAK